MTSQQKNSKMMKSKLRQHGNNQYVSELYQCTICMAKLCNIIFFFSVFSAAIYLQLDDLNEILKFEVIVEFSKERKAKLQINYQEVTIIIKLKNNIKNDKSSNAKPRKN